MAVIALPIPSRDFDPTEVAVPWQVLHGLGHRVTFATPDGCAGRADDIMLTGRGLDPWSPIPLLGRFRLLGLILRANRDGRRAYASLLTDPAFLAPIRWDRVVANDFDGLLLPGGHRARGMRPYLESPVLQQAVAAFFAAGKPVGAICHGVVLAARSIDPGTGRSVLWGRKTTALTFRQERMASALARFGRFWDPHYYRTYPTPVQREVTRALARPGDFIDVPLEAPHLRRRTSGLSRDSPHDSRPAWVVRDGRYVSARWPGDAHSFAATFASLLEGI